MSAATIPVFVFPNQIHFSTHSTRAQTITLYNPYDHSVRFAVLCTKPNAFTLSSSEGTIRARFCLDIVVRLVDDSITQESLLFTVKELSTDGRTALNGQKQVVVTRSDFDSNTESMPQFSAVTQTATDDMLIGREMDRHVDSSQQNMNNRNQPSINHCNNFVLYAVVLVCIILLWAPSDGDSWYNVHPTHKLVASYVLGLMTYAILRH